MSEDDCLSSACKLMTDGDVNQPQIVLVGNSDILGFLVAKCNKQLCFMHLSIKNVQHYFQAVYKMHMKHKMESGSHPRGFFIRNQLLLNYIYIYTNLYTVKTLNYANFPKSE